MTEEPRESRRLVIDFLVEFPISFDANFVAAAMRDYIHINRFTLGLADVKMYPANTRVFQQTIVPPDEMSKTTH